MPKNQLNLIICQLEKTIQNNKGSNNGGLNMSAQEKSWFSADRVKEINESRN